MQCKICQTQDSFLSLVACNCDVSNLPSCIVHSNTLTANKAACMDKDATLYAGDLRQLVVADTAPLLW